MASGGRNVLPGSGRLSLGPISSWFTKCVLAPVSGQALCQAGAIRRWVDGQKDSGLRLPDCEGGLITEAPVRRGEGHAGSHTWAAARMEGNGRVSFFSVKRGEHQMSSKAPLAPTVHSMGAASQALPPNVAKPKRNSSVADANSTERVLTLSV